MGTNKCASQAGMTAYGTRRHLYDPKSQTDKPYDQTTISLQMGTNKGASQVCPCMSLYHLVHCNVEQFEPTVVIIMVSPTGHILAHNFYAVARMVFLSRGK